MDQETERPMDAREEPRQNYSNAQIDKEAGRLPDADEYQEEYAAEVASPASDHPMVRETETDADDEAVQTHHFFGWFALVVAVASLFVWPAVLGPVGAIIGIYAILNEQKTLGILSIIIGAVSFIGFLFLVPLYS